jgi:hypothetical protein
MTDIPGFRSGGFAGELWRAVCRPKVSGLGIEAY